MCWTIQLRHFLNGVGYIPALHSGRESSTTQEQNFKGLVQKHNKHKEEDKRRRVHVDYHRNIQELTIIGYFVGKPVFMQTISKFPFDPSPTKKNIQNQTQTVSCKGADREMGDNSVGFTSAQGAVWGANMADVVSGDCYNTIQLRLAADGSGNGRVALYDESFALIVESASQLLVANSFNSFPIIPTTITEDTVWCMFQVDSATTDIRNDGIVGASRRQAQAFGTFPDPFVSDMTSNRDFNFKLVNRF